MILNMQGCREIKKEKKTKARYSMKEFNFLVQDEMGIHARPAGMLVKEAAKCASDIKIAKAGGGNQVNMKSIMAVMSLGVKQGQEVTVTVEGEDEEEAAAKIEQFMKDNF